MSNSVTIDNVSGGISNSIIAGGDVSHVTITVGGQETPVDKTPRAVQFSGQSKINGQGIYLATG